MKEMPEGKMWGQKGLTVDKGQCGPMTSRFKYDRVYSDSLQPPPHEPHLEKDFLFAPSNGGFLTAVNCIERIKAQCEHDKSDPAHYLRSMFDADKVREAVKYLCTNVKVYVHNADCIRRHHNLTTACTRESFKNFKTLAEANPNMDARIRYQCTFFETAVNCSVETVKTKCSPAAADIVGTVIRGLEPPRCSQITYSVSSGRKGEEDDGSESSSNGFNRTALLMPSILTLIASKLLLILLMY
ncbi:uncharacterized protein LOC106011808 [Aplysia californica]|uniref:Uncharacterized protein LOC106011808 n=1 Tax=Aplysia californica TaxID=6500 RepID=A0ABM1VTN2_APLCA|nr:uncharacterized protein LOC106011808 [Aplysia californica]